MSPLSIAPVPLRRNRRRKHTTILRTLPLLGVVNFTTDLLSRDKMPWTLTCWCFSWENTLGPPKNHRCGQKKTQKALALLYLASSESPRRQI